ncbi:MAG: hypothetical protein AB7D57_00735 [Desulfovibrionaceae bacterium]
MPHDFHESRREADEERRLRDEAKARLHAAYRRTFESEDGRTVLEDLERRGFMWGSTLHPDPQRTAFNEGRRSLVLHIRYMTAPDSERGHNTEEDGHE